MAFAVEKKDGREIKSSPYVYRSGSGDKFIESDLIDHYDYTEQDWYAVPVKEGRPVWSKPYYDEGGGEAWMKTYSIPIYSDTEKTMLIGVVTSDVLISKP